MFDFLEKTWGVILTLVEFFVNVVESLILALQFMADSIGFTVTVAAVLPSVIGGVVVATVSIFTIKFIVGR